MCTTLLIATPSLMIKYELKLANFLKLSFTWAVRIGSLENLVLVLTMELLPGYPSSKRIIVSIISHYYKMF